MAYSIEVINERIIRINGIDKAVKDLSYTHSLEGVRVKERGLPLIPMVGCSDPVPFSEIYNGDPGDETYFVDDDELLRLLRDSFYRCCSVEGGGTDMTTTHDLLDGIQTVLVDRLARKPVISMVPVAHGGDWEGQDDEHCIALLDGGDRHLDITNVGGLSDFEMSCILGIITVDQVTPPPVAGHNRRNTSGKELTFVVASYA